MFTTEKYKFAQDVCGNAENSSMQEQTSKVNYFLKTLNNHIHGLTDIVCIDLGIFVLVKYVEATGTWSKKILTTIMAK